VTGSPLAILTARETGQETSRERWYAEVAASLTRDPAAWLSAVAHGTGGEAGPGLTKDQGWILLSWIEDLASRVTADPRPELVRTAAFAFSLLEASPLDRRDVMVVGALVRRASTVAGLDFPRLAREGCARAGELGDRCLTWLPRVSGTTPATHEEVLTGDGVAFERKPSSIDVDELLRKYGKPPAAGA